MYIEERSEDLFWLNSHSKPTLRKVEVARGDIIPPTAAERYNITRERRALGWAYVSSVYDHGKRGVSGTQT